MDKSLDYIELTPEDGVRINAKMAAANKDTWVARTGRGEYVGWELSTFAMKQTGNKKTKEVRGHTCWHDAAGKKLDFDDGFPKCTIVGPIAPVKGIFVTMEAATKYDEGSAAKVIQKFVLDTEDLRCPDWAAYVKAMDSLFNGERIAFMVDTLVDHDYLSESHRKYFKKHGREKTVEKLLEDLADSEAIGHRYCAWSKAKNKAIKPRKSECDSMITPYDRRTLDSAGPDGNKLFDAAGKIEAYLAKGYTVDGAKKMYDLKLLRITKRNGTAVEPHELGYLQPKGMYASLTLECYGIHVRRDGGAMQHSVILANTHAQLCNNGVPGEHNPGMSIDDMFADEADSTADFKLEPGIDIGAVMRDAN